MLKFDIDEGNTDEFIDDLLGVLEELEDEEEEECCCEDCFEEEECFGGKLITIICKCTIDFGIAIKILKNGGRVAREGWNGKGMWLELQVPDEGSKMSRPYIYMKTVDDALVPWVASQSDILADDWLEV